MGPHDLTVVGIFEAGGGLPESEIWADAHAVQDAYNRVSYQTVRVNLESPDAFQKFKDALTSDPASEVGVERESEFYAGQSTYLTHFVQVFGGIVGVLMGLGAVFGAILTMYSAVAGRTREIATLRALGFGALPIVVSVLVEALLLGLVGGIVGGLIALRLVQRHAHDDAELAELQPGDFRLRRDAGTPRHRDHLRAAARPDRRPAAEPARAARLPDHPGPARAVGLWRPGGPRRAPPRAAPSRAVRRPCRQSRASDPGFSIGLAGSSEAVPEGGSQAPFAALSRRSGRPTLVGR